MENHWGHCPRRIPRNIFGCGCNIFRQELHVRAEKELLRLLGTQQVDVTKVVDAFASDVSRLHG
jgi:hypothetical protein